MNVEEAIRASAAAGPAYSGDLTAIRRRGRRYAHRRTAVKAGAVTAVLGVGSAAFLTNLPHLSAPTGSAVPSATASAPAAPTQNAAQRPWASDQRLVLGGVSGWMIDDVEIDTGVVYSELMKPDGKIVSHRFGGSDRSFAENFVPLPDGRFVVLRTVNVGVSTKPDAAHPDGPSNPDIETRLEIRDSKEKVRLTHQVRHIGEYVQLLAATGDHAYLVRPQGVVRHDFATGAETVVVSAAMLGLDLTEGLLPYQRADLEGNRLAVIKGAPGRPWSIDVYDVSTGGQIASYPLSGVAARFASPVRVSPDGTRIAFGYRTASESRMAVLDVATQALVLDVNLALRTDPYASMVRYDTDERMRAMAWSDDRTLRIAWAQLPEKPHGKYLYDKITTMRTFAVD
jgi:hypothetical protein